jgi:hypothetical protein
MSHWFDSFCLSLAGQQDTESLPRRNFLLGFASAVAATGLGAERSALGQPPIRLNQRATQRIPERRLNVPPAALQLGDQCKRTWTGDTLTQGVLLSQNGYTYQRQTNYNRATKSLGTSIEVKQGGAIVVSANATVQANGATTSNITYGPAVQGVHAAALNSPDGKSFSGTVDGRAIHATKAANAAPNVEFLDHRPAPVSTYTPAVGTTVTTLAKQAGVKWRSCQTIVTRSATQGPMRMMDYKPGANGPGDPGDGWYEPGGTYNAPDCDNCANNCGDTAEKYSGIDDWETYTNPVSFAYAMASYNFIWLACWGTCQLPGGGCCPVPCGGTFTCCGRNDHCFHNDLCCPANMVVCNNVCCGSNINSCAPDGSCGCPAGLLNCGEQCCQNGQICCGGQCCAGSDCQNNLCCTSPSHHCGDHCCPPFSSCCSGQCCSHTCVNNVCCPPAQVCGSVCCPAGQVCSNGTCFGCPGGSARIRRIPCHSILANGTTVGACCSQLAPTCCGGVCCGIGMNYCVLSNGQYVCTNVNPSPIR